MAAAPAGKGVGVGMPLRAALPVPGGRIALTGGRAVLAAVCLVGVGLVAGSEGATTLGSPGRVVPVERSRFDSGQGYVSAANRSVNRQAAQPRRPWTAAPLIAGSGSCLAAMDAVREIMHAVPSGGLLPRAPGWARLVGPRMGAVNAACGATTAQAFRDQEFLPWDNATIPTGASIPLPPPA